MEVDGKMAEGGLIVERNGVIFTAQWLSLELIWDIVAFLASLWCSAHSLFREIDRSAEFGMLNCMFLVFNFCLSLHVLVVVF